MAKSAHHYKIVSPVRAAMTSDGMTQRRLAAKANISEPHLSRFLSGSRFLSTRALARILLVLHMEISRKGK